MTTRSKPFGPSKKLVEQVLAQLREKNSRVVELGNSADGLALASLSGKNWAYCQAIKQADESLYFGKYHGTIERAARLEKLYRECQDYATWGRRMPSADVLRWYHEGVTVEMLHERDKGRAKAAQDVLKLLEAIGVGVKHVSAA